MAEYLRDGAAIYERSFAIIRSEADLTAFDDDLATVVVRMIHACGQTDLPDDIRATPGLVAAARGALESGAPILCDASMVAAGVTRKRLPADNDVVCLLGDPRVPDLAAELGTTRTAAAVHLWLPRLQGAVVAVGNAPTALFELLDLIDQGAPRPAAIVGAPVGFVGAAESCEVLAARTDVEFLTVLGRRGGSAITAAALNALASASER
ncbi:precorrin-8X methylmutase [Gordonia sp. X0973]|uniref:precorrin-8X methylmutase n=1 Tax=Gordonia sp. X0973 TaxID=2742602 RepID=UPI000F5358E7|nr:precorrin-8X methylmutase [Gordonia sp. X0973]QKT07359.1 precorrin-8X methylmutase [Gordonia sp. X0973]